uniref:Sm domain-containing protein n=1 Tax=Angiostrongylus cantonensis TaxID=6313 RepID=A0A0K0CTG3_ANGCA
MVRVVLKKGTLLNGLLVETQALNIVDVVRPFLAVVAQHIALRSCVSTRIPGVPRMRSCPGRRDGLIR